MITREEAKELLPVLKAWAEGRIIQFRKKGTSEWVDFYKDDLRVSSAYYYRIKPEPKYRPFKSIKECLTEMLNHSDIGYIRYKSDGKKEPIKLGVSNIDYMYGHECCGYTFAFEMFTFTDGEPFGIRVKQ